ncbi:MAG: glycoside hydrolase family 97 protein, partial [Anaerolineales bacterium]|nr:glycoside hydrolase family 97 protein [Anaerolineales bacterium]
MRKIKLLIFPIFVLLTGLLLGCQTALPTHATESVTSPDGKIEVQFDLQEGVPSYQVLYQGEAVILPSRLGFEFKEAPALSHNLGLADQQRSSYDQVWTQPWGEVADIRENYNQLRVVLAETTPEPRELAIVFRVFDDGLGFRYEWPEQEFLSNFEITDELTEFALAGDHQSWWIPAFWDNRYEYLYRSTLLSEIHSDLVNAVHTPFTMETSQGLTLSLHEAALVDYAAMALKVGEGTILECELFPWSDGTKVKASVPHRSPWRTIQIAEEPGDLITSYLILNLNEPNKMEDTSWIQPGKYAGIWWGMHIGTTTWGSGPNHGATTENARQVIDFAAQSGFDGVLVEGWNLGWDGDWTANGEKFSFTEPTPDFDIQAVTAYAASKGVRLIGHHETGGDVPTYERQIDAAFDLYARNGIRAVKTGYAGGIYPRGQHHHGQWMVEHYRMVVEKAAGYGIMLDVHEPIKPTGIRRTWPNMMTREGVRGMEYNAWSEGNPPEHTTILPFTRMLAGPLDYTPGIFDVMFNEYKPNNRVHTTLAKQLALYVTLYSPLQMAADLPENYEGNPAFEFVERVPCTWDETRVLDAAIGDYVVIARRSGDEWFL